MKWSLQELATYIGEVLNFSHTLDITSKVIERNPQVIDLGPVQLEGYIMPSQEDIIFHGQLKTTVTLPSTRSLKPVELPLNVMISERYVAAGNDGDRADFDEVTLVLTDDILDLENIAIDGVLSNLPIKVIGPDEEDFFPSGQDWQVITEDERERQVQETKQEESPFAQLKGLFDENQED